MLTLYATCLIVGGVLVALAVFAGGDVDLGADVDLDVEAADPELDGVVSGEGVAAAARFLSFRDVVFFAAFFGLTGTLFTVFRVPNVVTLPLAAGMGVVAAVSVNRLMAYLLRSETGALPSPRALEGAMAKVVVDVDRKRPGKIAVRLGDRSEQLVARLHEGAESKRFRVGEDVVIVSFDRGIAHIAGTKFLA